MSEKSLQHVLPPALEIHLSEKDEEAQKPPDKIQILRCGTFHHESYGKFAITPVVLREMEQNFRDKVTGRDLAIDYGHESERNAAGWIADIFLAKDDTELWARVKWSKSGKEAVIGKEYRYVSADFRMKGQDPETLEWSGPTLNGAALTNRPFIKRMAPVVQLSEGAENFDEEEEDMKSEENSKRLKELETENKKLSEQNAELSDKVKAAEDEKKKLDEAGMSLEQAMAKIKELEGKLDAATKEKTQAIQASEKASKNSEFEKLLSEGKAVEAQREPFLKGDTVAFAKLSEKVNLRPQGSGGTPPESEGEEDVQKAIDVKARLLLSENKVPDYGAGVKMVLSENPDLRKRYYADEGLEEAEEVTR